MKWYSVAKYKPPMEVMCWIFTENNYLYSGRLIDGEDYSVWAVDQDCSCKDSNTIQIHGVTHFCIPEPVEIE
jgi:hypothetical protein